jgi:hypothetical protein
MRTAVSEVKAAISEISEEVSPAALVFEGVGAII